MRREGTRWKQSPLGDYFPVDFRFRMRRRLSTPRLSRARFLSFFLLRLVFTRVAIGGAP